MTSRRTTEDRLVLACARTAPDIRLVQDLLEHGPDWERILRKTERWGLGPLVYVNLRQAARAGDVPGAVIENLRHLHHRDAIRGMAQREALRATLLRFSEASIPVIVLTGAALAALVYPSPTLRPMGAIDLLVRRHHLDRVDELLRGLKGALGPGTVLHIQHHIADPASASERPAAADRIPIENIWERARPARIESVATLVLGHEDLLLHLALNLAIRLADTDRFVGGVRTLCDIEATCRRYGDAIDWGRLAAQAGVYNVGRELYCALRLARDLVGAPVPSRALKGLRARLGHPPLENRRLVAVARRAILSAGRPTSRSGAPAPIAAPTPGESGPRPVAQGRRPTHRPEVAITYDQGATDGVGSQLHRIYGLYALSRALGIKYVHTPLGRVDYQGLLPLLEGRTDPDFAARYSALFSLPSDDFDVEGCERIRVRYPDEHDVEQYRKHAAATGRSVMLQAREPYLYTDRHPAAYRALRGVSPYRGYRAAGPVRVCIHMRRGDNSVPGRSDRHERLLPNSYYLRVCGAVVDALRQQGAPFVVRLHSEVPRRPHTLHPGLPGLYFRLDRPATLDPAEFALEELEALPNLEMVLNVEPREALDDFATADVLILSRSDLGYLGGLLNPHGLVIYTQHFHPALSDWLVADEHGDLDRTTVGTRVADHLRRRD